MARAARILKAELQAAGIDAEIKVGDFGFVKAQLERGRFDVALIGISPRPMSDLSPLLHSKGRLNVGRYSNPEVDRLLDALRATPPHRDRLRFAKALHRLLHEDPPLTVLYAPIEIVAVSREIHGIANNGLWLRFAALSLGPKR
jgi:peptide/nickel transport system substrate-binding protein